MDKCLECKVEVGKHYQHGLCDNCYENLFSITHNHNLDPSPEEPEFELKHNVATIKSTGDGQLYITNTELKFANIGSIVIPKQMVFNKDAKAKDYEKLVEFILSNMIITDHSPNFNKVSWMFKEVDKQ